MSDTLTMETTPKKASKRSAKAAAQTKEGKKPKASKKSTTSDVEEQSPSDSLAKASSAATESKRVKKAVKGKRPEVLYPEEQVFIYKDGNANGPMTVTLAKQLLGWQEETVNIKFGKDFLFRDRTGKKIRCTNNQTNRPFYASLAEGWMLEILQRRWKLNGENLIIDRTGMIQDGQHRLIGLVWAWQEWQAKMGTWSKFWKVEPFINTSVFVGIDERDDTVNTIGTGKPRSLTDVIYRSALFKDITAKERHKAARIAAYAVKLLWLRTGANLDAFSASRAHTEALDFIERHPKLLECVSFCMGEDDEKRLSKLIQLGYISALLYLFGSAKSEYEEYISAKNESVLDWSLWEKATEFVVGLAAGEEVLDPLRAALSGLDATGSLARDEGCGLVVNAWNAYVEDEPVTEEGIQVLLTSDDLGHPMVETHPTIGGIDCGPIKEGRLDPDEVEETSGTPTE